MQDGRGTLRRRIAHCEEAAGVGDSDSAFCECPVAAKDCIRMSWAEAPGPGEPEPEPERCPRCGKPYRVIVLHWPDDEQTGKEPDRC